MFRYLDERARRHNNRKNDYGEPLKNYERFDIALRQMAGKRLTF